MFGMIAAMETTTEPIKKALTVSEFIQHVVNQLNKIKHADGSGKGSFENYLKCDKRLQEFCKARKIKYSKLLITELTPALVNSVFEWVEHARKGSICLRMTHHYI